MVFNKYSVCKKKMTVHKLSLENILCNCSAVLVCAELFSGLDVN